MSKIKVFTTFSGYDSQCLGLDRLKEYDPEFDYELVGWSEIEKNAIKAHNALYPEYADRNLGDITKIDWSQVEDFDLFTYSSPCFPENTLVLTRDGYKKISTVTDEDIVLTHTGDMKPVIRSGHKHYKDSLYTVETGFSRVKCTRNHPFYVARISPDGDVIETDWIKAEDLKPGDYLAHITGIVNDETTDGSLESFYYLLGRMAGEKNRNKLNARERTLTLSCYGSYSTKNLYTHLCEFPFEYKPVLEDNISKFVISLGHHYDKFKEIEESGYGLVANETSRENCTAFLDGFTDTLLSSYKNDTFVYESLSKVFICVLGQFISKAFGTSYKVSEKTVNRETVYEMEFSADDDVVSDTYRTGSITWYPLVNVTSEESELTVYNLEVEDVHSYTADSITVHNCQSFSSAGLQHGGEEGSGTRSSLLWECKRCIAEKRPKFLLLENVTALVSDKFIDLFNRWIYLVNSYGYKSYWKILNAADFGVPQNRPRVFLVSIRNDIDLNYTFPEPVESRPHLYEILEPDDKVEEKLYRRNPRKDRFLELKAKQIARLDNPKNSLPGRYDMIPCGCYCNSSDKFMSPPMLDKSRTLKAESIEAGILYRDWNDKEYKMRLFTPRELFRLQGLRDEEIDKIDKEVPSSPQCKCAGNSICVDVLFHLFRKMFTDTKPDKNSEYVLF